MAKRLMVLAVCFTFLAGATVWADTINTSGQWNTGKVANDNTSGPNVFWDHVSSDGGRCNVGFVLGGTMGTCNNINVLGTFPNKPLEFLSLNGNSNAPVGFFVSPGGSIQTTYRASIAGFSGDHNQFHDVFGWALVGDNTQHPLFSSFNDTPNQTVQFTPGGNFRYYIAVYNMLNQLQWIHFSDGVGDTPNTSSGSNFFALFSQDPSNPNGPPSSLSNYWVGSEDAKSLGSGDFDYQDMLVQFSSVPQLAEPTSLVLFGSGLVGISVTLRKRFARM